MSSLHLMTSSLFTKGSLTEQLTQAIHQAEDLTSARVRITHETGAVVELPLWDNETLDYLWQRVSSFSEYAELAHVAVQEGHLDQFKYLVHEIGIVDPHGERDVDDLEPLLHVAVARGHLDIVQYLVEDCHADVSVYDGRVLTLAASAGNCEMVDYLSNFYFPENTTYLWGVAVSSGAVDCAIGMLDLFQIDLEKALEIAVDYGELALVKLLAETYQVALPDPENVQCAWCADTSIEQAIREYCKSGMNKNHNYN